MKSFIAGDPVSAADYFEAAIRLYPEYPDDLPYKYLATSYLLQFLSETNDQVREKLAFKASEASSVLLNRSEKEDASSAGPMFAIATINYKMKNFEVAKEWLNRVIEVELKSNIETEGRAQAHNMIAWINYDSVIDKMETISEINQISEEDKVEIQKTIDEGLQHVEKAIAIVPEFREAIMCQSLLLREKAKIETDEKIRTEFIRKADLAYHKASQLRETNERILENR